MVEMCVGFKWPWAQGAAVVVNASQKSEIVCFFSKIPSGEEQKKES
uniref:Uncharacterized protein n=1 Tax=viral metagenome TaxID=1070528 RepID=A0A6C0BPR9_9ZZZZ